MKLYRLLPSLLLLSGSVFAQDYTSHLSIGQAVRSGVFSDQKALATIEATNMISQGATALYTAGKSVSLQPGFEAKAGSVFTAHIAVLWPHALAESGLNSLTILAYPNPFEELTTITYVLTKSGRTSLSIRDPEGKLITQLVNEQYQEAGRHSVEWRGGGVAEGTYICILDAGPQRLSRRIIRK